MLTNTHTQEDIMPQINRILLCNGKEPQKKMSVKFDKSLEKAILRKKWNKVEQKLSTTKTTQSSMQCCLDCKKVHSITHTLCSRRAPLKTISKAVDANPLSLFQVDCLGKLPLHVAAENGASLEVIKYLTERCPSVAMHQDTDGKVPLHLACQTWELRSDCKNAEEANDQFKKVVKTLSEVEPKTLLIEDKEEMTPLECAIATDAPYVIVRMLQKATRDCNKKKFARAA